MVSIYLCQETKNMVVLNLVVVITNVLIICFYTEVNVHPWQILSTGQFAHLHAVIERQLMLLPLLLGQYLAVKMVIFLCFLILLISWTSIHNHWLFKQVYGYLKNQKTGILIERYSSNMVICELLIMFNNCWYKYLMCHPISAVGWTPSNDGSRRGRCTYRGHFPGGYVSWSIKIWVRLSRISSSFSD